MADIDLPFATQEGSSSVEQNSRETLINMFSEIETSGRKKLIRRQRPGLALQLANAGEKRCIERHKGVHYAVIGNTLYRYMDSPAALTVLGVMGSSTGRVSMIFNDNDQIMISDGSVGYYYNGTALLGVSSPVQVGHLAYLGGFGVFNKPNTGSFYTTALNDFSTVDALDFATAESTPDNLVRVFVDHSEVWLFGETSIEVWQLSGAADFPLSRFSNAQIERGCRAPFSVAADDNTVFWLGDDDVFYRADGYRPMRISNHSVERKVQAVPKAVRAQADAFVYTVGGNKFYTIRFPGYLTIYFNIATGFWGQDKSDGYPDWRIMGSAGHRSDYLMTPTGIVALDTSINQDEGGILRRGGYSAPGYANGNQITVRSFFLDAQVGRAPSGVTPQVMLRVARDGESFGNERWRSLGAIGTYQTRATWRNLGQGRNWTFELEFTDNANFAIMNAVADIYVSK